MNSIEDIAKMAIEEVGAELKELENSRILILEFFFLN